MPLALFGIWNVQPPLPLPFSGMPASLAVHLKVVGVSFRPVLRVIDGSTLNAAPATGVAGSERMLTALIVPAAGFPGAGGCGAAAGMTYVSKKKSASVPRGPVPFVQARPPR